MKYLPFCAIDTVLGSQLDHKSMYIVRFFDRLVLTGIGG